ncbi:MAG: ABC transporter ATP-binding protein [Gammaproteobacteria bacterium]|nr:ABC transporter ATP-binding protein [Gammaproteobacteria bacterium]
MNTPTVEVTHVSRRFGEVQALDGVDLRVAQGEALGLIGHNGAGKSTLIKLMLGLLHPDRGEIRIAGQSLHGPAYRTLRRQIAYLPENIVFYDNLSGLETLHFFADIKGVARSDCPALLEEVGLAHAARRAVRGYSKGMRQRLGFAQALLGKPTLLFLDEPTTGLDPEGIREFYEILRTLKMRGVTVILSSHNLAQIEDRVDRLALLRQGRLKATGTVKELRAGLNLPLLISLKLRSGGVQPLRDAFAAMTDVQLHLDDGIAEIRCEHRRKMPVLAALGGLVDWVDDVDIHEPSLEDVFLGYAEARDGDA